MKRVLLITYYWPPAGGPGVHRWLRMTSYMKEFGYEVSVITPENPHYQQIDYDGLKKVSHNLKILKVPIFEITRWFEKISGKKTGTALLSEKKSGFFSKLSLYIRGNYFVPDPKIFWVKPVVNFLMKHLKQEHYDLIITTGPPHSLHLIGLKLKKTGIKWVADFRDPWTNIDFYKELQLDKSSDLKHRQLEKQVLTNADMVTVIGPTMQDEFKAAGAKNCIVISNGFEFDQKIEDAYPKKFTLAHYGSIAPARNPKVLWEALAELRNEGSDVVRDISVRLVGSVDFSVKASAESYGIADLITYETNLSHSESIASQKKEAILLLIANDSPNAKGILTGKFFEYLNTARPIIAIGPPDGDLAKAIYATNAGQIFMYDEVKKLKDYISNLYQVYKNHELKAVQSKKDQYDTRNITAEFCVQANKLFVGQNT